MDRQHTSYHTVWQEYVLPKHSWIIQCLLLEASQVQLTVWITLLCRQWIFIKVLHFKQSSALLHNVTHSSYTVAIISSVPVLFCPSHSRDYWLRATIPPFPLREKKKQLASLNTDKIHVLFSHDSSRCHRNQIPEYISSCYLWKNLNTFDLSALVLFLCSPDFVTALKAKGVVMPTLLSVAES